MHTCRGHRRSRCKFSGAPCSRAKSMLAKVEALRETAATAVGPVKKAVNADLEVAVHALLRDLAFREVDEAERQSVEETLSTHAQQLKLALLRALGVSALHRALVLQPVLLESMRRMLCTVPHAGAAGILEKALGTDIDVSTDLCAAARATSLRRLPAPPAYGGRALHPLPRPPLARHRLPPLHLNTPTVQAGAQVRDAGARLLAGRWRSQEAAGRRVGPEVRI